ncbi:MFS transporter [Nonomuraea sp. NPDC050328]|uniref:MFS transporter n=1 Tax=Nonomuraea sp. NPDC050328 TaxID=3364361 RepID=UPI0037A52FD0
MTAPKTLDTPYQPPRIFGPQYRTATLGILLVVTLIAFEGMSVGVVMPEVSVELRAVNLYGISFSAFLIASLFANVVAGLWSDRRGHRVPFLLGVLLFVLGMALAGFAGSMEIFVAARVLQGLGAGGAVVAIYVMVARVYPPDARSKVFAALSAAWVLPAMIGPGLAGIVATQASWRWVFWGIVPLVVPALVMLLPALRQTPGAAGEPSTGPRSRPLPMSLAAAATAGGAAMLLAGITALPGASGRSLVLGGAGVVAGLVLLVVGLPRLLPAGAVTFRRGLATTIMMRGLLSAAFFGVNAYIPLLLIEYKEFDTSAAGLALTFGALGWSTGSYLQSRRTAEPSGRIRRGAACVTIGGLLTALAVLPGVTGWIMVPAWIIAGFGMGIGMTTVSVTAMQQSPANEQGANSAALSVTDMLGSGLAVGIGGALTNLIGHEPDQIATGYAVIVGLMALIGVSATVLAGRVKD